jgi:hypoxanthine phosphoribosyltransferase
MVPAPRELLSRDALDATLARLAAEMATAVPAGILLVGVLKGSLPFLADLARLLGAGTEVDFLGISTYSPESGRVRITKDLDISIAGRDVVVVEDIVDTGLTLSYVTGELLARAPRSLSVCTLLDRAGRRLAPVPLRFVGLEISDDFALGYGLDYLGRYRNLDRVVVGDVGVLRQDPDAYVAAVYG